MASSDTKPLKYSFKSSGRDSTEFRTTKERTNDIVLRPIGIKTPLALAENENDSLFVSHRNIEDVIKDNLKNLLLTNKGERLGRADFGASLRDITYEMVSSDNFEQIIMNEIQSSVKKYLPYIELDNFSSELFNFEPNDVKSISTLVIRLNYSVASIGLRDAQLGIKVNIGG